MAQPKRNVPVEFHRFIHNVGELGFGGPISSVDSCPQKCSGAGKKQNLGKKYRVNLGAKLRVLAYRTIR